MTVDDIARIILDGEVAAFPTETVYGLGALATDVRAVEKIFDLKGRPADNPMIVHICEPGQAKNFAAKVPKAAALLMKSCWPGPLTLIFKKLTAVPDIVTGGLDTVAIRIPDHPLALELIRKTGPLVAPSANRSGKPSPTRAEHVMEDLGQNFPVLDGGRTDIGLESTVLDVTSKPFTILRPGKFEPEELSKICGVPVVYASHTGKDTPRSPGIKYTHYKPEAKVSWLSQFENRDNKPVILITHSASPPSLPGNPVIYHFDQNYNQFAKSLYDIFRMADKDKIARIVIEDLPEKSDQPLLAALKNRIEKSTG